MSESRIRIEKKNTNAAENFGIVCASLFKEGVLFEAHEEEYAFVIELKGW